MLLFMMLTANYTVAQNINDTIIKNVVRIDEKDIVQHNNDILIDVVIDSQTKKNPIIFNNTKYSKDFFANNIFKQKTIMIITPDWKYYDEIAKEADEFDGCIEPATTNILYQRKISGNTVKTDSIRISGKQPKLIFKPITTQSNITNAIVYYHTETYSSSCCPRDPKWEVKEKLDEFISSFEVSHKVKLGEIYKRITGKEGEHILYFTLSSLTTVQKLRFLQQIRSVYRKSTSKKDKETTSQIFIPKSIRKNGLQLITN